MAIDQANVDEFLGRFVADLGAMFSVLNVVVGDKLGRYKVPAAAGPLTAAELAERTHTSERYGAKWLAGQAARRLCHLRPGRRVLPAHRGAGVRVGRREQPAFLPGAFQLAISAATGEPWVAEAFRTGAGLA